MGQIVSFEGYTPPARFDSVPWSSAKIEEAAAEDGPWTLIDTIAFNPVDTDPADPQTRSFTTTNGTAPALWYRVTFADATGGESSPTTPIRNDEAGPPALFATADDLADRLGIDLTAAERVRANALLAAASALIQDETDQVIGLVTDDVYVHPGTTDDRIELPQRPVISVSSVTVDGQQLSRGGDWYLEGDTIFRVATPLEILDGNLIADPYAYPFGVGFGSPEQTVTITYTHGYADAAIPGTIKAICLEAVVRVWVNPGSVARETVGDTATVYDNMRFSPSGLLLTGLETKKIRRLFPQHVGSVQFGS